MERKNPWTAEQAYVINFVSVGGACRSRDPGVGVVCWSCDAAPCPMSPGLEKTAAFPPSEGTDVEKVFQSKMM